MSDERLPQRFSDFKSALAALEEGLVVAIRDFVVRLQEKK